MEEMGVSRSVSTIRSSSNSLKSGQLLKSKCLARCRLCRKVYKFTLKTKGNLLKHLQTTHLKNLDDHRDERAKELTTKLPLDQCTLSKNGSMRQTAVKPKREAFRNRDKIISSIVKNLCGRGGMPICTVEQDWFRDFMRIVEPKFENVSRVAVSSRLDEIYEEQKRKLLAEIKHSDIDKPTVTVDFWTGCNGKSYMGATVHYIHESKLKNHVLFFV